MVLEADVRKVSLESYVSKKTGNSFYSLNALGEDGGLYQFRVDSDPDLIKRLTTFEDFSKIHIFVEPRTFQDRTSLYVVAFCDKNNEKKGV